jgi:hypothetical protein
MKTNSLLISIILAFKSCARSTYLNLKSIVTLPYGFCYYYFLRKTPEIAHQSMIWLFCFTQGRFIDWVSERIEKWHPKIEFSKKYGVLGDMSDPRHLNSLVSQLRNDGYVVFPSALPTDACDRLMDFTRSTPAIVRLMDGQDSTLQASKKIYCGHDAVAIRYDYDPSDLLNHEDVQSLLADGSLLTLVQEYLGCMPVADVLSMWWHTNFHDKPDSNAAQFFHFDMDRFKWLKIFIYLTDVGADNGPHAFVEGSHITGGIPVSMLKRGYVRLTDEEVLMAYSPEKIHSFSAPRGSIIIEDTRGLHKGVHVKAEARLILQLQFSNCLFGTNYPKATASKIKSEAFQHLLKTAPEIHHQYV